MHTIHAWSPFTRIGLKLQFQLAFTLIRSVEFRLQEVSLESAACCILTQFRPQLSANPNVWFMGRDKILSDSNKNIHNLWPNILLTITVGAVIWKCEKYKLTINYPQHGAQSKIFLMGWWMMMRKGRVQPTTAQEGLGNDLKAVGSTATKDIIGYTLRCKGLKETCWKRLMDRSIFSFRVHI